MPAQRQVTQRPGLRTLLFYMNCLLLFASISLFGSQQADGQEPEELTPVAKETQLFNGENLDGWMFYTQNDRTQVEDVWTVKDGVLQCSGRPAGYLQTKRWYRDYELNLQWRWPGESGGNSGVLVHTTTPLVFYGWPKSLEVQLMAGNAADFWVICKGVDIRVEDEANRRPNPREGDQHSHRRIRRLPGDFEKPVGEWNTMKVICRDDNIQVYINDQLANEGTECTVTEGAIALQSEGTAIEFRNISVKPLGDEASDNN